MKRNTILIAPLNWGLGHATRCVPIINALIANDFYPIIASDGIALDFLKKEFPDIPFEELPSYNIKYSRNKNFFLFKLFTQLPRIVKTIREENRRIKEISLKHDVKGIISDNRLGVYHKGIPSVYVTHQTKVLSGFFTYFISKIHHYFINKHTKCWIPDVANTPNLSGKLSHNSFLLKNHEFIGPFSRFSISRTIKMYDYCIIISGPEPQRSLFEKLMKNEFKESNKKIAIIGCKDMLFIEKNITLFEVLNSQDLEKIIHDSDIIISRSGYTTIMDLAFLNKKSIFIPTPGQKEQEYLAKMLQREVNIPYFNQESFSINDLDKIQDFGSYYAIDFSKDWQNLLAIFE